MNDASSRLPAGPPSPCTIPVPASYPFTPAGALPTACPAGTGFFQPIGAADIGPGYFKKNPLEETCSEWQNLA